jgi:hypothetical protein
MLNSNNKSLLNKIGMMMYEYEESIYNLIPPEEVKMSKGP